MFDAEIDGIQLRFVTSPALFSPNGLDAGTRAMLSLVAFPARGKILDLGCGYGAVGIYAAKLAGEEYVTMSDVDEAAVAAAKENAALNGVTGVRVILSDGFDGIGDAGYAVILSNPPYHADFSVAKRFIEKGFNRLAVGGKFYMVTKRETWYKNKFTSVFGGVTVRERDGYFVFIAEKRTENRG